MTSRPIAVQPVPNYASKPSSEAAMAVLPSNLPDGASLPLIVGGALMVAWVIGRF